MDPVEDTTDVLQRFVAALEQTGIPYMLTGSFASAHYGHYRGTEDIDFVIMPSREQLRELVERFPAPAFYVDMQAAMEALQQRGQFNVIDCENAYKADFIIRKDDLFNEKEFGRRVTAVVANVPLTIATAEDVILSKLQWSKLGGSLRQIEDAAGILDLRSDRLDWPYIESWVERLSLQEQWDAALSDSGTSR